jgi:hypothetical protein
MAAGGGLLGEPQPTAIAHATAPREPTTPSACSRGPASHGPAPSPLPLFSPAARSSAEHGSGKPLVRADTELYYGEGLDAEREAGLARQAAAAAAANGHTHSHPHGGSGNGWADGGRGSGGSRSKHTSRVAPPHYQPNGGETEGLLSEDGTASQHLRGMAEASESELGALMQGHSDRPAQMYAGPAERSNQAAAGYLRNQSFSFPTMPPHGASPAQAQLLPGGLQRVCGPTVPAGLPAPCMPSCLSAPLLRPTRAPCPAMLSALPPPAWHAVHAVAACACQHRAPAVVTQHSTAQHSAAQHVCLYLCLNAFLPGNQTAELVAPASSCLLCCYAVSAATCTRTSTGRRPCSPRSDGGAVVPGTHHSAGAAHHPDRHHS